MVRITEAMVTAVKEQGVDQGERRIEKKLIKAGKNDGAIDYKEMLDAFGLQKSVWLNLQAQDEYPGFTHNDALLWQDSKKPAESRDPALNALKRGLESTKYPGFLTSYEPLLDFLVAKKLGNIEIEDGRLSLDADAIEAYSPYLNMLALGWAKYNPSGLGYVSPLHPGVTVGQVVDVSHMRKEIEISIPSVNSELLVVNFKNKLPRVFGKKKESASWVELQTIQESAYRGMKTNECDLLIFDAKNILNLGTEDSTVFQLTFHSEIQTAVVVSCRESEQQEFNLVRTD